MAESNKYYWIKLKTDFFNQDAIDFLMGQENGCEYIVLYQMLCLQTANENGRLITQIGEIIVPYDAKKIVRDTKYFDFDTVTIAMELFKRLGLIYEMEDNILEIANFGEMVGSASLSKGALKQKAYRDRKNSNANRNAHCNTSLQQIVTQTVTKCPTEYRDKSIEIRDKSIDNRNIENKSYNVSDETTSPTPKKEVKHKFGEFKHIKLTDEQHEKLISDFGENVVEMYIKAIDEWIEMKGKPEYKNSNLAIRNWISRDKESGNFNKKFEKPAEPDYSFDLDEYKSLANTFGEKI